MPQAEYMNRNLSHWSQGGGGLGGRAGETETPSTRSSDHGQHCKDPVSVNGGNCEAAAPLVTKQIMKQVWFMLKIDQLGGGGVFMPQNVLGVQLFHNGKGKQTTY